MKLRCTVFGFGLALLAMTAALSWCGQAFAQARPDPVRIIFDTDMWGDIDDVMALAMLHALQDRGEINIVAITGSTDDKWCASYIDLIDTYYGHAGIPIGLVHGGVRGNPLWFPAGQGRPNYTQFLSERRNPDGSLEFPHRLTDGSVIIVEVGFSTNLARLIDSPADAASPLDGAALVSKKVRLLSVMAGNYSDRDGHRLDHGNKEFNIHFDVPAAQSVFSKWPTPVVASGFEIGNSMKMSGRTLSRDLAYAPNNPVLETYRYTDKLYRDAATPANELHDHATFDLTSVLYAARPEDGYFTLSDPGMIKVMDDSSTRFDETTAGTQRYLIMNDTQRTRALEAMTLLVSQPPRARPHR